ncbi:DNA (cytosine-5)-methyltransferase CMT3-like [Rhododendron vialii]|uniref:DNA (cytosine-5)-methyltransferase CMT3-like n=1 Tax=Rhododendron vialii TaxID=182163 RepID=UPI00265EB126|nr:DNA (cytosine-5)-methyltransferase CMT3-like [Rhododendron vialii]
MFKGTDKSSHFTTQWYYRTTDTINKNSLQSVELIDAIDDKHVFFPESKDDNPLNCLFEKLTIVRLPSNVDLFARQDAISNCDYYYDTKYLVSYSSFVNLPLDNLVSGSESDSTLSSDSDVAAVRVEARLMLMRFQNITRTRKFR